MFSDKNENNQKNDNNEKIYYRSEPLQSKNSLNLALNELGYKRGKLQHALLVVPSGYNNIENELKNIRLFAKNKYIFGITGCDKLAAKDSLWRILESYHGRRHAKRLMPNTYLFNQEGLQELAKDYTSDRYILKKNIQRKEGIRIVSDIKEIMDIYQEGDHGIKDFKIIQEYVKNPYCINGHKLNLRLYILMIMKDSHLGMYCYKDGKCMYTKMPYSPDSSNFHETITNFEVTKDLYHNKDLPLTWKTLQTQNNQTHMNKYIKPKAILNLLYNIYTAINDSNNEFQKTPKLKKITMFQLFGADIIFKPEPILLELNKGPEMSFQSTEEKDLKMSVLKDTLELNLGQFHTIHKIDPFTEN